MCDTFVSQYTVQREIFERLNFRKHLSQNDFEKIFSKILQTMHDKVYGYISYLVISKKHFRKCSNIFEIFEN